MTNTDRLHGVVPIIPTPFTKKEEIDEAALRDLIEFAVSSGIKAVCLPAYASEFYKLTDEEKIELVKIAVNQVSGRLQIVAQSNSSFFKNCHRIGKASHCQWGSGYFDSNSQAFQPS